MYKIGLNFGSIFDIFCHAPELKSREVSLLVRYTGNSILGNGTRSSFKNSWCEASIGESAGGNFQEISY